MKTIQIREEVADRVVRMIGAHMKMLEIIGAEEDEETLELLEEAYEVLGGEDL